LLTCSSNLLMDPTAPRPEEEVSPGGGRLVRTVLPRDRDGRSAAAAAGVSALARMLVPGAAAMGAAVVAAVLLPTVDRARAAAMCAGVWSHRRSPSSVLVPRDARMPEPRRATPRRSPCCPAGAESSRDGVPVPAGLHARGCGPLPSGDGRPQPVPATPQHPALTLIGPRKAAQDVLPPQGR